VAAIIGRGVFLFSRCLKVVECEYCLTVHNAKTISELKVVFFL